MIYSILQLGILRRDVGTPDEESKEPGLSRWRSVLEDDTTLDWTGRTMKN